jgi:dTDP-4-dehydrorhamnose 3,5-epimerase
MTTQWREIILTAKSPVEIPGLPGVRVGPLPVHHDPRGSLHELWRSDEIPSGFQPLMACSSWSLPGVTRGPHEHHMQDDYFTFAGPSEFLVGLWDARPGGAGANCGWWLRTGDSNPSRLFVPHGVVHVYRNTGKIPGLVVTVANVLFRGAGRKGEVDEIRHENDPRSPYQFNPVK